MIKFLLTSILTLEFFLAVCQQPVPIFADKRDSIEYSQVQSVLQEILRNQVVDISYQASRARFDSLMQVQSKLRDRIIGYKITYKPAKDFTSYQSLKDGTVSPAEITKLSFSDNRSTTLPPEIFQCVNLTELELVNTSVRKLPSKLNKLNKLRSIYLYNNVLPGKLRLAKNSNVLELVIRGVDSRTLPKNYKKLTSLDTLDLSRNINMTSFPNIYKNRKLRKLNVFENGLTLADLRTSKNLPLEELNIQRNKIKVVPDAIGSFSRLKKLTFNYNQIAEVKGGIRNLKDLESLSFYQNKLTTVPSAVFELGNLTSIDLYYNQIQNVGADISKLRNLRILYLSNNKLASLPEGLTDLSNLRELYLHDNKIERLPESIQKLQELRILRANNNYLTSLPSAILSLNKLENLDFSRNYLDQFPAGLSELKKLQILGTAGNPWENKADVERVAVMLRSRGGVCLCP